MKKVILFVSVLVVGLIFYSLFKSENINSLDGGFEELAFVRNENNTGPINRVYAFSVRDTLWLEMQKHTDLLPHTKYGTTKVYYFLHDEIMKSELKLNAQGLNQEAISKSIAHTIKDGQSRIRFMKYPY
jgi:hypothetical protein